MTDDDDTLRTRTDQLREAVWSMVEALGYVLPATPRVVAAMDALGEWESTNE